MKQQLVIQALAQIVVSVIKLKSNVVMLQYAQAR